MLLAETVISKFWTKHLVVAKTKASKIETSCFDCR